MPKKRFKRISVAQLLVGVCVVVFGAGVVTKHARAQFAVPPPPPPVFNPSPPNTTVPQPSYKSISPATPSGVPGTEVTSPENEGLPRTTARAQRSVHHYRGRLTPVTYRCGVYGWGYYGCWRTYPWAFPCQYYSTYCPYGFHRPYGWSFNYRIYGEYRY
jgi:hypothetical protein